MAKKILIATEIAVLLKNDAQYKNLPVILITAQAQKCQEQAIKEIPVDFCTTKPFDFYELKSKIDELLNTNRSQIKNIRR